MSGFGGGGGGGGGFGGRDDDMEGVPQTREYKVSQGPFPPCKKMPTYQGGLNVAVAQHAVDLAAAMKNSQYREKVQEFFDVDRVYGHAPLAQQAVSETLRPYQTVFPAELFTRRKSKKSAAADDDEYLVARLLSQKKKAQAEGSSAQAEGEGEEGEEEEQEEGEGEDPLELEDPDESDSGGDYTVDHYGEDPLDDDDDGDDNGD